MTIFGIGLDQSVLNEPTGINLADWANLGLFRLAIARRRVTTMKIYIDKTGSAETLLKIEAFLYCIFEVSICNIFIIYFWGFYIVF